MRGFAEPQANRMLQTVLVWNDRFQLFYEMKLKTSKSCHFEASKYIMTKFKSQALHSIRIKYWNAIGSGNPPPESCHFRSKDEIFYTFLHTTVKQRYDLPFTFFYKLYFLESQKEAEVKENRVYGSDASDLTWPSLNNAWFHHLTMDWDN